MTDDTTANTESSTLLGVRVPEPLRSKIKAAAAREERTESSFVRFYLGIAADQVLADHEASTADGN